MEEFDPNSQRKCFKPPVPKPRLPLRKHMSEGNDFNSFQNSDSLFIKDNLHKIKQQNKKYFNNTNNDIIYSDVEDDDNDDDDDTNLLNDSYHSVILDSSSSNLYNSPDRSHLQKRSFRSPNTSSTLNTDSNSSFSVQKQSKSKIFKKYNYYLLLCIIFIGIGLIIILNYNKTIQKTIIEKTEIEENKINKLDLSVVDKTLNEKMKIIQTQFYNQKPSIWNDISSGMYDVATYLNKPLIIILFGNETDTLNYLAQLLGQLSGIILNSNDYLTLTPQDFPNNTGQTIHNLKIQILQKRVLIVHDLLNINTEAIKAFHNFCDRENPLIRHAIYIITVIVDEYKPMQRELEFIERQMMKKLSGKIDKDILLALITRLTDGIIVPVLPESTNFK